MQLQQRRSRMRRTSSGKRLELTVRDLEIFKHLERYRYLRSTYIHAFVGGASQTRFKERLGDLFHEGYLDRPARQWDYAEGRHSPTVHEAGAGSERILRQAGIEVGARYDFLAKTPHWQFQHALMICELLASLDLGVRANPSLRFIGWPEILERAPEATGASGTPFRVPLRSGSYLVPDGLFGLEYGGAKKSYRFFALEADRGTMPIARSDSSQTSYLGKLAAYREIVAQGVHKTHWGLPNLLVVTVTNSAARLAEIMRRLQDQACNSPAFLFKATGEFGLTAPAPQLLLEPWQRAGLPPLCIAESN
jgi:hypothetical protein